MPGVSRIDIDRKVFDATLHRLRITAASGTLHTTYERILGTCTQGGADYHFNINRAFGHGRIHPSFATEFHHLRGLCDYKPDGTHRPIGMPECEVRFYESTIQSQHLPATRAFYTNPLPEDARDTAAAIDSAQSDIDTAPADLAAATGQPLQTPPPYLPPTPPSSPPASVYS